MPGLFVCAVVLALPLVSGTIWQTRGLQDLTCTFESGNLCGWGNNANAAISWRVVRAANNGWQSWGKTDHTTGTSSGKYAYLFTYDENPGSYGDLLSSPLSASSGGCLKFWYNMLQTTGTLTVYFIRTSDNIAKKVFVRDGDQGNTWHQAKVSLIMDSTYIILIRHSRGDILTETGVAIDDITVTSGFCSTTTLGCGKNRYGTRQVKRDEEAEDLGQWVINTEDVTDQNDTELFLPGRGHNKMRSGDHYVDDSHDEGDIFRRILEGEASLQGQWPWITSIRTFPNGVSSSKYMHCGGSLIDKQWVVTAAHCFEHDSVTITDPNKVLLYFGEHNTGYYNVEESQFSMKAAKVIIHPSRKGNNYDIAMVKLQYELELDENVNVVCMPDSAFPVGSKCLAAGWGIDETGSSSPHLMHLDMNILSETECGFFVSSDQVCAIVPVGIGDVCQGDSGGPLVCKRDGVYELAGAVSFGDVCANRKRTPGIYANIFYFKPWIQSIINA